MGIGTVRDLLGYFPRDYDDRRSVTKIAHVLPGKQVTILGKVEASEAFSISRSLSVFKVAISDGTGIAFALFYRKKNPYHRHDVFGSLKESFAPGRRVALSGTFELNFNEKQIKADEYETSAPEDAASLSGFMRIVPVYPLTEGINQKWLRGFISSALETYAAEWPDIRGDSAGPGALSVSQALRDIHFPQDLESAERARLRLAFDEFLLLETALELTRSRIRQSVKPRTYEVKRNLLTPFREKLNFEFTAAQKKVINEIFSDIEGPKPMNRLLMGDVGSGKTVVAVSAMLLAVENGYQAALLAPTEILAEQHYLTLNRLLDGLPVKTGLLTGRLSGTGKKKTELRAAAASGATDLLVGTHALLEKKLAFERLGLVVIDEQHRFGVLQRAAIQQKAEHPDVLVMTATPIPRTLALTLYGDTDVSVIDRLPPGRRPIATKLLNADQSYDLVKKEVRLGRQAYIVYPLVEESDKLALKAATSEAEKLSSTVFRDLKVGLLHGQMGPDEKEKIMKDFRAGNYDILIATTVIEVGIDVPNATVMVIEHADRFGLATLHQLRGRVGRGTADSYCILVGDPRTDEAKRRMEIMQTISDGFKVAEEDLALRGPGEFFGTSQHGLPVLRAGNIVSDTALIEKAKATAREIAASDPALAAPANGALRSELVRLYGGRFGLLNK